MRKSLGGEESSFILPDMNVMGIWEKQYFFIEVTDM